MSVSTVDLLAWTTSALAILGGWCVIGFHRPVARRTAMHVMLLFGTAGMLVGLWMDADDAGVAWLTVWCGGGGFAWQSMWLHWQQLPAMHAGMLLGGLCALPVWRARRLDPRSLSTDLTCNLFCSAWMVVGMDLGGGLCRDSASGGVQALLAMLGGMLWGMAVSDGAMRAAAILLARRRCFRVAGITG